MQELYREHFMILLRQSVQNKKDFHFNIKIEADEWEYLYKMAAMHCVLPMLYDVLSRTEVFETAPVQIKTRWRRDAMESVICQTRKTKEFLKINEKLQRNGIKTLVVKGLICRMLYEHPDFRLSGDEDILIEKNQFSKCDKLLSDNGFSREETDVENPDYETRYVHKNGMQIEVHISLMPETNTAFAKLNPEFIRAFETKKKIIVDDAAVYTLDWTTHFFYLLCHSYKHFIFRGVGVRQLCDMIKMAEKHGNEIHWSYIVETAKKHQMYLFWANLFDIGEKYLGFDRKKSGCPQFADVVADSKNLLEDMLEGGAYGKSAPGREHSTNMTLSAVESTSGKALLRKSLFPSKKHMKEKYEYVRKHSWLLPAAYIQRIFEYRKKIKIFKKDGLSQLDSVAIGKKRVALLKQYSIISNK